MANNENITNTIAITERSSVSMKLYLKEIYRTKPLSAEEEAELACTILRGGPEADIARNRLIKANLRYVVSVAKRYKSKVLDLSDLISEGNYGLVKAADHFDGTKGVKFITYATYWIKQAISQAVANCSTTFRLPQFQHKVLREFKKMDNYVLSKEGRHISIAEFCEVRGYSYENVALVMESNAETVQIDESLSGDSEKTYGDIIPSDSMSDSELDKESLHIDILDVMNMILSKRERVVVKSVLGIGRKCMSYEELAEEINLSRERIRQIYHQAMDKLSNSPYSSRLIPYLAA